LYPGSKFILTTRPFEEWIERRRLKPADPHRPPVWKLETRIAMYGSIYFDEKLYSEAYFKHHVGVEEYFVNRKNDLLTIPLTASNKWELLCGFLEKEIPNVEYPWEGKAGFDPLLGKYQTKKERKLFL